MDTELELAKVRLNSAQDSLMDAQLTWAHAHRDWLRAVNKSARGGGDSVCASAMTCSHEACMEWRVGVLADMQAKGDGDKEEKGREGVGPHTHAGNTKGREYHTAWCEWWMRGKCTCSPATPTGTHATQVPASKGVDTTSRK